DSSGDEEIATFTATLGETGEQLDRVQVTFIRGPVDPSSCDVQILKLTVVTTGTGKAVFSVTRRDRNDRQLGGEQMALTSGGSYSTIEPELATTDGNGQAVFRVSNTMTETVAYMAELAVTGQMIGTEAHIVQFIAGQADVSKSTITVSATELIANGT